MTRSDLIALTDDGLTQLSNGGIVKRSQRDLAADAGPVLDVAGDGTIEARFSDGTLTRLATGKELADASCTCPSSGVCRHRIMLAMAYRDSQTADTATSAPEPVGWNPATLDLDGFESTLGPSAKAELTRLMTARHTVRLDYGQAAAAHLPMASVRFLVPDDLGYARCDCVQGRGCVHVALAIRAFRAADGAGEAGIGGETGPKTAVDTTSLAMACEEVVAKLLDVGVLAGMAGHAQQLEHCRRQAELLGASQVLLVIDALIEQVEAYEARSARHDERAGLRLATELLARVRASDTAMALGLGEPFETAMAKTRLVSLGARLRQEGDDISASVLLADSDTGATMLMEKLVSPTPNEVDFHSSVLRRQFGAGLPVQGVGRGQILTSVARRRADGLLALGSGTGGKTQVMPRDGNFSWSTPLMASRTDNVIRDFAERPLSLIRPRKRVDDVHVFEVEAVLGQSWSAGTQYWQAAVKLANDGGTLHLEREFDSGAPAAPGILSAAFEGRWGEVRQIAGKVRLEDGVLVCEPWSISADRFIVPDLDALDDQAALTPPQAMAGQSGLLDDVERLLSGAIHAGGRARGSRQAIGKPLAAKLAAAGFGTLSARLGQWLNATPDTETASFRDVAIWLLTLKETRESQPT